jgi:hypothetical protein
MFEDGVGARRVGHHLIIEQVEVFALLHRNRFLVLRHRGSSDVELVAVSQPRAQNFFSNGRFTITLMPVFSKRYKNRKLTD